MRNAISTDPQRSPAVNSGQPEPAETSVRTLSLSSWNFRAALKEHPSTAIKMLEESDRRVRTADVSVSH